MQISALKFFAVKHLYGLLRFLVGVHFDNAKSTAFSRGPILHHIHGNDSARLRKEVLKLVLKNRKREISDKQLCCHKVNGWHAADERSLSRVSNSYHEDRLFPNHFAQATLI